MPDINKPLKQLWGGLFPPSSMNQYWRYGMNLEQMIDEVYGKHQAELKAKVEAQKLQEQQEIERAIALFRADFDGMISLDLQRLLGIKFSAKYKEPVDAEFVYRGKSIKISRWCSNEAWKANDENDTFLCGGKSDVFLNLLLIELGKIRDSSVESEPELMSLEQATDLLEDCINLADEIYNHRRDFIHNPEEFGNNLKTAICLMSKLLDELAEVEEE